MNYRNIGAAKRPALSLSEVAGGGERPAGEAIAALLSPPELRRLVAAMVD